MNFRPRRREEPDVNLTPMIDVVFLLLIFFIVSTTFRNENEMNVDLPEAGEDSALEAPKNAVEITIDSQGKWLLNGEDIATADALEKSISNQYGDKKDLPFIIRADAKTPHQSVVSVMEIAARLGFKKVGIATVNAQ